MPIPEIEEFAKVLVQQVRDSAIQGSDQVVSPDAAHAVANRWRKVAKRGVLESVSTVLIPDVVDHTVFQLLWAIDQGLLKLSFTASNGMVIDLSKDGRGELAGWYMGSGGWRAMFSRERFVDDFADLK